MWFSLAGMFAHYMIESLSLRMTMSRRARKRTEKMLRTGLRSDRATGGLQPQLLLRRFGRRAHSAAVVSTANSACSAHGSCNGSACLTRCFLAARLLSATAVQTQSSAQSAAVQDAVAAAARSAGISSKPTKSIRKQYSEQRKWAFLYDSYKPQPRRLPEKAPQKQRCLPATALL